MDGYEPLEREAHTRYKVYFLEKLIINFALPSDLLWHTVRAFREHDTSQTTFERIVAMWKGKVVKYQKLLRVKDENGGTIPADYQELCRQTPCGKARLYLASMPFRNPKMMKSQQIAQQKGAGSGEMAVKTGETLAEPAAVASSRA